MTGECPFCGRKGVEMAGTGELEFCTSCADLIDVPAALRRLPDRTDEPGARLGKYEIVRELAKGASGAVYEARDPSLDRRVALKVLDADGIGADLLPRFLREGRLLARIRHPNVVEIHELGRDGGKVFIAMEYVDGVPFPGAVPREEALKRLIAVARALHHVHRQGIIHRDLKPTNILVDRSGRPVLMDFGIARAADASASTAFTATGAVLGTLGFMAPEQISGNIREIDARTDVYALGVLLFEILAGRLPIQASTVEEYARELKKGRVPGPRAVRRDVPAALDRLCRRAMAPRREDRPGSAEAFAAELAEAGSARPSVAWRVAGPVALAAGIAAVLAGGVVAIARSRTGPTAAAPSPAGILEEAAETRARALGGTLSFEPAMVQIAGAEALYRRVLEADPGNAAASAGLGRLYADLGRAPEAHREFDRLLAADPANLDVLRAKGNLIVTAQLELLLDRKAFPRVTKSQADALAVQQGRRMEALSRSLPPDSSAAALAAVYAAVAQSRFDEARRLCRRVPPAQAPPYLEFAVQALAEQGRPAAAPAARPDDDNPDERSDAHLWLAILRHLEHRSARFRSTVSGAARTRIHAALLRLDALSAEARGERAKAAEALTRALIAAPEDLAARLHRMRLLKELGQAEAAARDLQAALRSAQTAGLSGSAIDEIRSLP